MANILRSLSNKVFSTILPKFVVIQSSVLILGKSAFFNQCLVSML